MTKAELVSAIADKAGLNRAQAKEALDAFIASVSTTLKAGTRCDSSASEVSYGSAPRASPAIPAPGKR